MACPSRNVNSGAWRLDRGRQCSVWFRLRSIVGRIRGQSVFFFWCGRGAGSAGAGRAFAGWEAVPVFVIGAGEVVPSLS